MYLEITSIRHAPRTYTSPVLAEMARFRPFTQWMFSDRPIYSFHSGIPIPPPLAVLPLKRFWAGDMTNERMARELEAYKPGIILLRNDSRPVTFQALLESDYALIYEDQDNRLYAHRSIRKKAGF